MDGPSESRGASELFRYEQFCPVARAAEVLGQRWNLLLLRELFLGPMRFSDLRARLRGVSSSVLAERLRELEARGVVASRELPPPAATGVYELTDSGKAFWPALVEIARWGVRFLLQGGGARPEDHVEADWFRGAAVIFARRGPSPALRVEFRVRDPRREVSVRVAGGPGGTRLAAEDEEAPQARVTGSQCCGSGQWSLLSHCAVTTQGSPTLFSLQAPASRSIQKQWVVARLMMGRHLRRGSVDCQPAAG